MIKALRKYTLAAIVCIPLFFINVKDWSDWGDDFAQYMHQSVNLIKGKPQNETGYIFNPNYALYAPVAYPSGFPLLLAPLIKWKGTEIYPLSLYVTFFLAFFGILLFKYISKYYSTIISILLVIIFLYNPWTLAFKGDVVSDIPFAFFFLLITLLYTTSKKRSLSFAIVLTVLCAFTLLIRSIGIVFPIALIAYSLIEFFRNRKYNNQLIKKEIGFSMLVAASSFIVFFLVNKFVFPVTSGNLFGYKTLVNFQHMKEIIQTNLTYYTGVLRAFFEPWNDNWQFVSIISASMIFTFIIIGIVRKIALDFSFTDALFFIYLIVIIIYPYSNAGFRFLFPLIPFLMIYLMKGILSVDSGIRFNRKIVPVALTLIVLFSYKKGISEVIKSEHNISEGPQVPENAEMFRYIIENTNTESRFSFKRPRALAFYTGRSSMTHRNDESTEEIMNDLSSNQIEYILINQEDYDQNMVDFINANGNNMEKVWSNSKNTIYKLR